MKYELQNKPTKRYELQNKPLTVERLRLYKTAYSRAYGYVEIVAVREDDQGPLIDVRIAFTDKTMTLRQKNLTSFCL